VPILLQKSSKGEELRLGAELPLAPLKRWF